ncbi:class I SAM-dependent methyltransferase [Rhodoplanes sp. Z2-YC6860]|uniref:class I SAM-dependent methyltransferase n=1 Tax=Rhodoplanes sp. Z2-YC6860 TaxID=674703 RepID=UPI00082A72CA|nr:class I SAM-dependent methyltransferase [Rhodoplanes sp. Z2-YC6860]
MRSAKNGGGERSLRQPTLQDREYESLDSLRRYTIVDGSKIAMVTRRQERLCWLEPVFNSIDQLLCSRDRISVHEVGCGSTINLRLLRDKYGNRVTLSGSDVAPVQSSEFDVLRVSFDDPAYVPEHAFDIVFSNTALCLSKNPNVAFRNVLALSHDVVVLVEPIEHLAMQHQKMFLRRAGHSASWDELAAADSSNAIVATGRCRLPFSIKHPAAFITLRKRDRLTKSER